MRELFVEDLDLDDDRALPGILGDARVVDSVLCLGTRPPAPLVALAADRPASTTPAPLRLDLDGPGAIGRHLGPSTHDAGIDAVVAAWTTAVRAARAADPRAAAPPPVPAAPSDTDLPEPRTTLLTTGA